MSIHQNDVGAPVRRGHRRKNARKTVSLHASAPPARGVDGRSPEEFVGVAASEHLEISIRIHMLA